MFDIINSKVVTTNLASDAWANRDISLSIVRLDMIDPVISGNKLFKLYYFVKRALEEGVKVITLGGAYSNHLAAAASACNRFNIPCIGIVRGEKPPMLSPTLVYCAEQRMQLEYISRAAYRQKDTNRFQRDLQAQFGNHVLIPEGGFGEEGVRGAAKIMDYIADRGYTHICCSVGTATTVAGLVSAVQSSQQVLAFSALKQLDFEKRMKVLGTSGANHCTFISDYHFGGYAKRTQGLIEFMNSFYQKYSVPLDFVYTGKMMYGIVDMITRNYFSQNSRIICIHTGGLMGNNSLKPGVLTY